MGGAENQDMERYGYEVVLECIPTLGSALRLDSRIRGHYGVRKCLHARPMIRPMHKQVEQGYS